MKVTHWSYSQINRRLKQKTLYLLHGHASTEDGSDGEIASVAWVACRHHVLGIKHLLRELWNSEGTVLLATTTGQRSKAGHEEVQTWEWNHVDGQLAQISVQLPHHDSTQYNTIQCNTMGKGTCDTSTTRVLTKVPRMLHKKGWF